MYFWQLGEFVQEILRADCKKNPKLLLDKKNVVFMTYSGGGDGY